MTYMWYMALECRKEKLQYTYIFIIIDIKKWWSERERERDLFRYNKASLKSCVNFQLYMWEPVPPPLVFLPLVTTKVSSTVVKMNMLPIYQFSPIQHLKSLGSRSIFLPGACIGHGILHQEIQRSPGNQDVSAWNATCNQCFFVILVNI